MFFCFSKERFFLRFLGVTLCVVLLFPPINCQAQDAELSLFSTSAVLIDGQSGRVLYGKEPYEPMANASTTKIMTCILLLELCDEDETVTVSEYAASMPKVNCGLRRGESYLVMDLLYSLMLESHNDSAVALAEHVGKRYVSELYAREESSFSPEESKAALKAFSNLMNEKARTIGCENTYFITPNGLDATESLPGEDGNSVELNHHTTAWDLARILSYCILRSPQKERFLEITRCSSYMFSSNGRQFHCQNHNSFLYMMDGVISGKTGFTGKAGYCYVGALERDDRIFVIAILACGWPNNRNYKWKDARTLFEYGIDHFQSVCLKDQGILVETDKLPKLLVREGQSGGIGEKTYVSCNVMERSKEMGDNTYLLSERESVSVCVQIPEELTAPVMLGQKLGEIHYMVGEELLCKETIVSEKNVPKIDFLWCLTGVFQLFCIK